MKNFEYMCITVSETFNGEKVLNDLGMAGWEICASIQKSVPGCAIIYLKKEIP